MNWLINLFLQDPPSGIGRQSHQVCQICNYFISLNVPLNHQVKDFPQVKDYIANKLEILFDGANNPDVEIALYNYELMQTIIESAKDNSGALGLLIIAILAGSSEGHFDFNLYVYKVAAQILKMSRSTEGRDILPNILFDSIENHTKFPRTAETVFGGAILSGEFPSINVRYIVEIVFDNERKKYLNHDYSKRFTKKKSSPDDLFFEWVIYKLCESNVCQSTRLFALMTALLAISEKKKNNHPDPNRLRETAIKSLNRCDFFSEKKELDHDSIIASISGLFPRQDSTKNKLRQVASSLLCIKA